MKSYLFPLILTMLLSLSFCALAQDAQLERPVIDVFNEAMALKSSDYEKSAMLYYQLRERQNELSKENQLEIVYLEAYLQMMRGYYESAIETHSNLTKLKDPNLALRAYANMLAIDVLNRNFLSASKHLTPLLEILNSDRSNLNGEFVNVGLITVGHFYLHLGDAKTSLRYLNQLYFTKLSKREKCFSQIQITKAQVKLKLEPLTTNRISETIELCRSINESFSQYSYMADIALVYMDNENYQLSLDFLQPEVESVEALKFNRIKAEVYSYLANSFYHTNEFSNAEIYAHKTIEITENTPIKIPEKLPEKLAYEVLYNIAIFNQDEKNAYGFLKKFIIANEAYIKEEHFKALGLEQAQQDLIVLVDDINTLDQQVKDELNLVSIRESNNRKFNIYIGIERLIHVVLIVIVLYQLRSVMIAIKEARSERQNLVFDKSTKALHRDPFFREAKKRLILYENQQKPIALIIFNLDSFRQTNEFQGSDKADWVIKTALEKCFEISDKRVLIGRLGGDEFAILLPDYTLHQAQVICSEYKDAIFHLDTRKISYKFNTTASFGITDNTVSQYEFEQMLTDADSAMQMAKTQGGNTVQTYSALLTTS